MDKIIVIGGGGHAKVVISILKKLKTFEIYGCVANSDSEEVLGVRYLGNDSILDDLRKKHGVKNAVLGIGHIKDNSLRHELQKKAEIAGYSFPVIISPDAIVNEGVSLGEGTVVMDGAVIISGTKVSRFGIINTCASIDHDCDIGDFSHIAPGAILCGGVKVGNNSLIAAGAIVSQYLSVKDDCIVGAGSVVLESTPESGFYVGIPAKKVRGKNE